MNKYFISFIIFFVAASGILTAEELIQKRNFGITASASPENNTIGVIYNFSDTLALRPSFGFYQNDNAVKEYSLSADLLFFANEINNFTFFYGFGLRTVYEYASYEYSDGTTSKETSYAYGGSAIIGGQYMLSERFGFYADTGVQASVIKRTYEIESNDYEEKDNNVKFKSATIGALFYFY